MDKNFVITKGDVETFAIEFCFQPDPDHGKGAAIEESLSWGGVRIWVRGRNLCEHFEGSSVKASVNWYLIALMEWVAENWNPLFHEEKYPGSLSDAEEGAWRVYNDMVSYYAESYEPQPLEYEETVWHEWWQRHGIYACRNGGLLPDLFIRRYRDQIELSWGEPFGHSVPDLYRFRVPPAAIYLDPEQVAVPLYEAVSESVQYLLAKAPDSERLKKVCHEVQNLPSSSTDQQLAWMAGLQKGKHRQAQWQSCKAYILSLSQKARNLVTPENHDTGLYLKGSCHAALMFGTVSPTITQEDVLLLSEKMVEFSQNVCDDVELVEKRSEMLEIDPDEPPWIQGYDLAEQFIEHADPEMGIGKVQYVDIEEIIHGLNIRVDSIHLSDDGIRAVALAGKGMLSTILLNLTNESNNWTTGRRFTLAHELCHLLIDRSYGQKVAIASGPWAPIGIEKRANAFAAMLLMPREHLSRVMGEELLSQFDLKYVRNLSNIFGVGIRSVIDHLHNFGYLDAYKRQRLHLAVDRQAEMSDYDGYGVGPR